MALGVAGKSKRTVVTLHKAIPALERAQFDISAIAADKTVGAKLDSRVLAKLERRIVGVSSRSLEAAMAASSVVITMTMREADRLKTIQAVVDRMLRVGQAAQGLDVSPRQIERMLLRYAAEGPIGLTSRQRGRPQPPSA